MPGETSIALQTLLVSLTPTTHISAAGHRDKVAASIASRLVHNISQQIAIETKRPLHCLRPHPPPSIRNPVNNTMLLKYL